MLLLQASLERLQIAKLALYQIHFPAAFLNGFANTAFVRGLAHCQQIGLTDAVGVSNFNEKRLREAHQTLQVGHTKPASMRAHICSMAHMYAGAHCSMSHVSHTDADVAVSLLRAALDWQSQCVCHV